MPVATAVVGRGVDIGFLTPDEVREIAREGLAQLPLDGKRVLVLIPDGTRTMPMPLLFDILEAELARRAAALDFLVALGTHAPMSDAQLSQLVGRSVVDGRAGERRIFNHRWDDPASFATLGTIPAREIEELTSGRLSRDVDGGAEPAAARLRPRARLRSGVSARGGRASRAAPSTCSPASPARRSSTSRTGSARSSPTTR